MNNKPAANDAKRIGQLERELAQINAMYEQLVLGSRERIEILKRGLVEARKEVGEHLTKLQERAEAAERENAELRKALEAAEAVFSIVEPRSDKAEYLRVLQAVRTALAAQPKEKT